MPETRVGKAVHKSLELALGGMLLPLAIDEGVSELGTRDEEDRHRRICLNIPVYLTRIEAFRKKQQVGRQFVEYRLAMTSDGQSTAFYAKDAFYRGIVDVAYRYGDNCLALVDHKTGMRQPNANIAQQLESYAVLALGTFRNLRKVVLGIHWVTDASIEWAPALSPEQIQEELRPNVLANIEAAALAVADGPRCHESPWCERCSYRSVCPQGDLARFEPIDIDPEPGL